MAVLIWRGDAQPVPQVTTITPANVEVGDIFTCIINRKTISFTATAGTVANVVAGLVAAINANAQDIPEWDEVTASSGTTAGEVTHVVLTGPDDGKPFTVTTSTTNGGVLAVSVTVETEGIAATNEKQLVTLAGPPSGGTFTLTFDGQTTATIDYDASAATVDAALEALSNIAAGDVTVTGNAGGPWTVEFLQAFAATDVPLMTGDGSSLTGSGSITGATTTQGSPGTNEVQRLSFNSLLTLTYRLVLDGVTSAPFTHTAGGSVSTLAAAIQAALEGMSNIGTGNVTVANVPVTGDIDLFNVTFINAKGAQNISTMTASPSASGLTVSTLTQGTNVGTDEVQTITVNGAPTGGTFTLTFSGQTTAGIAFDAADSAVVSALEALSNIGVGDVAVVRTGSGTLSAPYVYTITFGTLLGDTDVAQITGDGSSLTGGSVGVATIQDASSGTNEVQEVELTGSPDAGNFSLTFNAETTGNIAYNASAATVLAALEGLATPVPGDFEVVGPAGGPWVITFKGAYAATDVAAMTGTNVSLTGGGSQTLAASTTTTPTGPNWFDDAENWTNNTQPASGDTVIFENSDVDCLYGLDTLTAQTLAELRVMQSYTGRIGLPTWTGLYYEYRQQYLTLGATLINIGQGDGAGSGRIKINTGSVQTALAVFDSGSPEDGELPSVIWKGTNASNAVRVLRGSAGAAVLGGEAATILTLDVGYITDIDGDSTAWIGRGVTLGTVSQSGGDLLVECAVATSHTMTAGEASLEGLGAVAQLNVRGGNCFYSTSGTLGGNTVVSGDGLLDFSQDMRAKTVTNPIEVFGDVARVRDPFKVVTTLIIDGNNIRGDLSQFEIGPNVRLTRGTPA